MLLISFYFNEQVIDMSFIHIRYGNWKIKKEPNIVGENVSLSMQVNQHYYEICQLVSLGVWLAWPPEQTTI